MQYQHQIEELCDNHNVKRLYVFGLVLTSEFSSASDVDLIVEFNELEVEKYADNYFDCRFCSMLTHHSGMLTHPQ
jgi:predicted nucleotidyltransferase